MTDAVTEIPPVRAGHRRRRSGSAGRSRLPLAEAGFAVAIHCRRSRAEADALAARDRGLRRRAAVLQADLADEAEVAALVARAADALGPLGVLVNNASTFERDEWDDATRASWDAHMEPNLRAPFVLTQAFAARACRRRREGLRDQHARPAGLVADAAFRVLHGVQGRAVGADPIDGAGPGAAHPGQRHRPRPGAAQPAADRRAVRPAMRVACRSAAAPSPDEVGAPCWPSWPCRR